MTTAINDWLHQLPPIDGVFACGVRHADQSTCTRTFSQTYGEQALDNAWRCVADTFQVLKLDHLPTAEMRWTYEHAFLFATLREDGAVLAVFTARDAVQLDAAGIERMFAEFAAL